MPQGEKNKMIIKPSTEVNINSKISRIEQLKIELKWKGISLQTKSCKSSQKIMKRSTFLQENDT